MTQPEFNLEIHLLSILFTKLCFAHDKQTIDDVVRDAVVHSKPNPDTMAVFKAAVLIRRKEVHDNERSFRPGDTPTA